MFISVCKNCVTSKIEDTIKVVTRAVVKDISEEEYIQQHDSIVEKTKNEFSSLFENAKIEIEKEKCELCIKSKSALFSFVCVICNEREYIYGFMNDHCYEHPLIKVEESST